MSMERVWDIWKWLFSRASGIFSRSPDNDVRQSRRNEATRYFQMSSIPTLRGRPLLNVAGRPGP